MSALHRLNKIISQLRHISNRKLNECSASDFKSKIFRNELIIFDENDSSIIKGKYRNFPDILGELELRGLVYEKWDTLENDSNLSNEEVLKYHSKEVNNIMKRFNFKTKDIIQITPDNPKKEIFRKKFLDEHTHSDLEVRYFVDGAACFYIHLPDKIGSSYATQYPLTFLKLFFCCLLTDSIWFLLFIQSLSGYVITNYIDPHLDYNDLFYYPKVNYIYHLLMNIFPIYLIISGDIYNVINGNRYRFMLFIGFLLYQVLIHMGFFWIILLFGLFKHFGRLRVERQLGWKFYDYINIIYWILDSNDKIARLCCVNLWLINISHGYPINLKKYLIHHKQNIFAKVTIKEMSDISEGCRIKKLPSDDYLKMQTKAVLNKIFWKKESENNKVYYFMDCVLISLAILHGFHIILYRYIFCVSVMLYNGTKVNIITIQLLLVWVLAVLILLTFYYLYQTIQLTYFMQKCLLSYEFYHNWRGEPIVYDKMILNDIKDEYNQILSYPIVHQIVNAKFGQDIAAIILDYFDTMYINLNETT